MEVILSQQLNDRIASGRRLIVARLAIPYDRLPDDLVLASAWDDRYASMSGMTPQEEIWDVPHRVTLGIERAEKLYATGILALSDFLNSYHELKLDVWSWEMIIGPWLQLFTHQLVAKIMTFESFSGLDSIASFALDQEDYYFPWDPAEFTAMLTDHDGYQWQLWTPILKHYQVACERLPKKLIPQNKTQFQLNNRTSVYKQSFNNMLTSASHLLWKENRVLMTEPYIESISDRLKLIFKSHLRVTQHDYYYPCTIWAKIDETERLKSLNSISENNCAEDLVFPRCVKTFLPILFLEGFRDVKKVLDKKVKFIPEIHFSANAIHSNDLFRILLAFNRSKTKLLYQQHGAGYGMDRRHVIEELERKLSDKYFTCGWPGAEKDGYLPVPKLQKTISKNSNSLTPLFSVNVYPRFVYRIHHQPMGGIWKRVSEENIVEFFRKVNSPQKILMRVHPIHEYGWRFKERLLSEGIDCQFDDNQTPFIKRLRRTSIYISNHYGTSFLESVANDIPTLLFLDKKIYCFRDSFQTIITRLKQCKMVFDSPTDAAEHYNEIHSNPSEWWEQTEVRDARQFFLDHYLKQSISWQQDWISLFNSESPVA